MKSAMSPSQKTGAEMPKSANPIARRSQSEPGLRAERVPMATPTTTQMIAAPKARKSVRGALSFSSPRTG